MSINPNKKDSPISYRTIVATVIFLLVVFVVSFLFSRACEAIKNHSGKDEETDEANEQASDGANDKENNFSDADSDGDGIIYIPISPSDTNDGGGNDDDLDSYSPPISVTEKELLDSLMVYTQDQGTDYINKFFFLTDSSLYGLKSHSMLADSKETDRVLTGVSSSLSILLGEEALVYMTDSDSMLSVPDAVAKLQPLYLLVSVGADDVKNYANLTFGRFYSAYSDFIKAIIKASPDTVVICMPILPGSSGKGPNIYKADQYNEYIHMAAAENGAYYIEISSAFASSSGSLRVDCDAGNSSLNTTGLKRVLDLVRSYKVPTPDTESDNTADD